MNRYECSKCGESMTSKNPLTRNVFPSDQYAALMTNIINVITTTQENGLRKVVIEFPYTDTNPCWTNDELEMRCVEIIREIPEESVKHWLCDHLWLKRTNNPVV